MKITLKGLSKNKNTSYANMIMMILLVMMMVAPRLLRRERRDLSVGRSQTPSSQDLPMLIIRMIMTIITMNISLWWWWFSMTICQIYDDDFSVGPTLLTPGSPDALWKTQFESFQNFLLAPPGALIAILTYCYWGPVWFKKVGTTWTTLVHHLEQLRHNFETTWTHLCATTLRQLREKF